MDKRVKKYAIFGLIALLCAAVTALHLHLSVEPDHDLDAPIANLELPANMIPSEQRGKMLIKENCTDCHGPKGGGKQGVGPPLVYPNYKPSRFSDEEIRRAIKQGAPEKHWDFEDMPPIKGLSNDDVTDIIAYIRKLQKTNSLH